MPNWHSIGGIALNNLSHSFVVFAAAFAVASVVVRRPQVLVPSGSELSFPELAATSAALLVLERIRGGSINSCIAANQPSSWASSSSTKM
jgi:hypothetical protein